MGTDKDFWRSLARELSLLTNGDKEPADFVRRFYILVEEVPPHTTPELRAAFEEFHYYVANYEQNPILRSQELGLIGERELLARAKEFLQTIERLGYST